MSLSVESFNMMLGVLWLEKNMDGTEIGRSSEESVTVDGDTTTVDKFLYVKWTLERE